MSDCFSYKKSPLSHCETNFVLLTEMFDKHYVLYYIFTTPGKDTTCSKWACQHKQTLCLKCLVFGMEMVQVCEQNEGMQPENRQPLFLLKEVKLHLTKNVSTIQTIEARWMTRSIEARVSILGPVAFTKADLHKQAGDLKGNGRRFSHQPSILWLVCWEKRGCETVEFEKNLRRCWHNSLCKIKL